MDENNNGIPDSAETVAYLLYIIVVLTIVGAIIARFTSILERITIGGTSLQALIDLFVSEYLPLLRIMSLALTIALIVFIIYVTREHNKVLALEREKLNVASGAGVHGEPLENKRWLRVVELINSEESPNWKLAILEADIMLQDMLDTMGYQGQSIGEQLQQVEKSDFRTLDSAWEAHKIRNSIAHEGEEFLITQREAQRVIRLFEEVFLEFQYI